LKAVKEKKNPLKPGEPDREPDREKKFCFKIDAMIAP